MNKTRITHKKTCPACNGRGKSYGSRYCGACRGKHTVTETVIIEELDDVEDKFDNSLAEAITKALRNG